MDIETPPTHTLLLDLDLFPGFPTGRTLSYQRVQGEHSINRTSLTQTTHDGGGKYLIHRSQKGHIAFS